jgi:hypothetical protein
MSFTGTITDIRIKVPVDVAVSPELVPFLMAQEK